MLYNISKLIYWSLLKLPGESVYDLLFVEKVSKMSCIIVCIVRQTMIISGGGVIFPLVFTITNHFSEKHLQ